MFSEAWSFVVACEVICRKMIVGLRGTMVVQVSNSFRCVSSSHHVADFPRFLFRPKPSSKPITRNESPPQPVWSRTSFGLPRKPLQLNNTSSTSSSNPPSPTPSSSSSSLPPPPRLHRTELPLTLNPQRRTGPATEQHRRRTRSTFKSRIGRTSSLEPRWELWNSSSTTSRS